MPSIAASFVAAKEIFRDALLDLVGINFRICGISIDPGHRWRCFRRRQRAVWAISGSRHQPRSRRRSVSCDRVKVNKPKLWNFDRPLGLPGYLQWSFRRRQRVISSKYDGAGAWQLPLPSAAEQQSRSHRRKCERYTRYLQNLLGLSGRCRQCFWQRIISSKNEGASPW